MHVSCRGLSHLKKGPFRKWYGCLGQLRSLIPDSCKIIVLTARATKKSRHEIFESLNLPSNTTVIQQSPNRKNVKYTKHYLDKKCPVEVQFGFLSHFLFIMLVILILHIFSHLTLRVFHVLTL